MARFIPDLVPEDFNNSIGEEQVYEALHLLDDKYTIFYSLNWIGTESKNTLGEADFLIFHPEKGILVLEIKAGEIEYKNGEWIQTNTKSKRAKRINPFNQARKSLYEIKNRLDSNLTFHTPLMGYAVWFTSIVMPSDCTLPLECTPEITFDKRDLMNPEKAIEKCFKYWGSKYQIMRMNDIQSERVIDILCPQFHIVPKLKTKIEETETIYIRLTHQQAALLDFLDEQDTAVIHGLAGTGKTLLAIEKAKRLTQQDESVLFLCYNSFLRDYLRSTNSIPGVSFHNAHSLAYEVMGISNSSVDKILDEFEDYLEKEIDPESWKYRNIVVDEGQDLDDRLINRLYELTKSKHGNFYVFYDPNQSIMRNILPRWIEDADCRLVLQKNCRNTAEIFNVSCRALGMQTTPKNGIHGGDTPAVSFYSNKKDAEAIVGNFVQKMASEGLKPEDIVILSARTLGDSCISLDKEYGGYKLSDKQEDGEILFTTIRKYKGLESRAVLIVDFSMSSILKDENKKLLYVGASRARNILRIAMLQDVPNSDMGEYLHKLAPERTMPKNIKGFKRLLGFDENV